MYTLAVDGFGRRRAAQQFVPIGPAAPVIPGDPFDPYDPYAEPFAVGPAVLPPALVPPPGSVIRPGLPIGPEVYTSLEFPLVGAAPAFFAPPITVVAPWSPQFGLAYQQFLSGGYGGYGGLGGLGGFGGGLGGLGGGFGGLGGGFGGLGGGLGGLGGGFGGLGGIQGVPIGFGVTST